MYVAKETSQVVGGHIRRLKHPEERHHARHDTVSFSRSQENQSNTGAKWGSFQNLR